MNFKALTANLCLTFAACTASAADIDLSTGTTLTTLEVAAFALDMLSGKGAESNNAVIFQDIKAVKAVAFIDQNGTSASIAVISQSGANDSVAYIQQTGTVGAVAVIVQR
jgi:hypothetical protein